MIHDFSKRAVLSTNAVVLPVSGITPDKMRAYLDAGTNGFGFGFGIGIGSALYGARMTAEVVSKNAIEFIAACA